MSPIVYCRQKIKHCQQTSILAYPFLSSEQRNALCCLHAYQQELNEVVDNCFDIDVAVITLKWWEDQTKLLYQQDKIPDHPVLQILQKAISQFELPESEILMLIQVKKQLLTFSRFNDQNSLNEFAIHSGYIYGRLSTRVLGFKSAASLTYADQAGKLYVLSYIFSKIGADAKKGKLYLPIDLLQQFNIPAQVILNNMGSSQFNALMSFLIQKLKQQYDEALKLLPVEDKNKQKPSLTQLACSYALLEEIRMDGVENLLRYQLVLPKPRQFRIAMKVALWGFRMA